MFWLLLTGERAAAKEETTTGSMFSTNSHNLSYCSGFTKDSNQCAQEEEVFWLLMAGERAALKEGRLVEARVRNVTAAAAFCTLPDLGGLEVPPSLPGLHSGLIHQA